MSEPIGNRRVFQTLPGGGYGLTWIDDGVRFEVRHLRREFHKLHGEVTAYADWHGVPKFDDGSMFGADMNLSVQSARESCAKTCETRTQTLKGSFDWKNATDTFCRSVINAEREGVNVICLDDAPEPHEADFDIHGWKIPKASTSMLIAHGDSMKSLMGLYAAGYLAQRGIPALFVDHEWTGDRHLGRKRRLFGNARLEHLRYLRATAPLSVEGSKIRRVAEEHGVQFTVIDSVGLACDGKLADDDTAIRFHRALDQIPGAKLATAHVPKSSLAPDAKGDAIGPFGSVFFSNLCRASWLVKKEVGASDDIVSLGLFPQKQNAGERNRPLAFEVSFSATRIDIRPINPAEVDGFAQRLPLHLRIAQLVKARPLTFAELATELDAKVDSVIKSVNRQDKLFTKVPGSDGIARIALISQRVA